MLKIQSLLAEAGSSVGRVVARLERRVSRAGKLFSFLEKKELSWTCFALPFYLDTLTETKYKGQHLLPIIWCLVFHLVTNSVVFPVVGYD